MDPWISFRNVRETHFGGIKRAVVAAPDNNFIPILATNNQVVFVAKNTNSQEGLEARERKHALLPGDEGKIVTGGFGFHRFDEQITHLVNARSHLGEFFFPLAA